MAVRLALAEVELKRLLATYPGYADMLEERKRRGRPKVSQNRVMLPAPSFYIRGWFEAPDTHGVNCAKLLEDLLNDERDPSRF